MIAIACGTFVCSEEARAQTNSIVLQVSDLDPGVGGSSPSEMRPFGDALFFCASTPDLGEELWRYTGSRLTLVSNINANFTTDAYGIVKGHDSSPNGMTPFNDLLYFAAYDERRGTELWKTDGTNAVRAADIHPDANDDLKKNPASSWPKELTVVGNNLFFPATTGTHDNYELWKFDGTNATLATNIHPDSGSNQSSFPNQLIAWNNALYFQADDGSHGYELWKHDVTRATLLADINPTAGSSSSFPKHFTAFNNCLYFQAFTQISGFELWRTDGTNTAIAKDIFPGGGSSSPEFLTVYGGALYFRANGPAGGSELWKFDGTNGTIAADVNPFGDSYPKNLTVFQDTLCFAATDGSTGWELWTYNGTSASLVTNLHGSGDSFPEHLTVFEGALYFVATTPETGYELWKYDGSTVTLVRDINPGPGNGYPLNLTVFNNQLCFSATDDGFSNWELWRVTNTTNGYLGILPALNFTSTGEIGGPFSPWSLQYTLTNHGSVTLDWSTISTQQWLSISPTNGTLIAGGSAAITVSLSPDANLLGAGTVTGEIYFINNSTGEGTTIRGARLEVLPPVAIANAAMVNGELILQFSTQAGSSYTVEHTDDLLSLSWYELTTLIGPGGMVTVTNSNSGSDQRYYRLRKQ